MKTKVIAFRVTQDEYAALYYMARTKNIKLAEHVNECLTSAIMQGFEALQKERKKAEAKAKRDAKKAAANGAQ
jgi:hypothetical protein